MTFRPAATVLGAFAAAALIALAGAGDARAQYSVVPNAVPTDANGGGPYPVDFYSMQTLGRPPEVTGDYGYHYLESPYTGTTYADPAYYAGMGALDRWNRVRPSSGAGRVSRKVSRGGQAAGQAMSPAYEHRIVVEDQAPRPARMSRPVRAARTSRVVRAPGCGSCGVPAEMR